MSPNTADELSLINHAEFLQELEQFQPGSQSPSARAAAPAQPEYRDSFAALDRGLDVEAGALPVAAHDEPACDGFAEDVAAAGIRSRPESRISMIAAAFVLLACLTAGAATAALMFSDRVGQITAVRQASR
jgi:hypothetical protein